MRGFLLVSLGLLVGAVESPAQRQAVSVSELDSTLVLVGKLHAPLGTVVTVEGVVVEGPSKGYESGFNLRVQRISGRATQEDIQIVIRPYFTKWGEDAGIGEIVLPSLTLGATYEMEGYETGGYVGVPSEALDRGAAHMQTCDHRFRTEFAVFRAKQIPAIRFGPQMFEGTHALIQGQAVTKHGHAVMVGDGWTVVVQTNEPWPTHVEGKRIETYGVYNPDSAGKQFKLLDGTWRLTELDDQVGREVELRGVARSMNGVWWFHYRGTDLYVEGMENLPGWTGDNHWRPMVIRGRLEKAVLPRIDQVTLKTDRDLKEYFIVRDPSWKPLPALLSPERPWGEPD